MDERELPAYPFKTDRIYRNKAVKFIASVVDPQPTPIKVRAAEKRVREHIEYGINLGDLTVNRPDGKRLSSEKLSASELFNWAVRQKGWWRLYQIRGIPITLNSGTAHLSIGFSIVAGGGEIPTDKQELERQFLEMRVQLLLIKHENEQLKLENAMLQAGRVSWRN